MRLRPTLICFVLTLVPATLHAQSEDVLLWRFVPGETHRFQEHREFGGTLGEAEINTVEDRRVAFEVRSVEPDGSAAIAVQTEALRLETSLNGVLHVSDSGDGSIDAEHIDLMAGAAQVIVLSVTQDGRVLSATPPDDFRAYIDEFNRLRHEAPTTEPMTDQEAIDAQSLTMTSVTDARRRQLEWPILPGEPPEVGLTWETHTDYPFLLGTMIQASCVYRVSEVGADGRATIAYEGSSTLEHGNDQSELMMEMQRLTLSGTLVFDARAGELLELEDRLETEARLRIPDQPWKPIRIAMHRVRRRL